MSFLKITEPKKRDLIVAEFLKTKKNIQRNQLAERLGEQDAMAQFTRQYKPITDLQKDLSQNILSEIKNLPKAIDFPRTYNEYIPAIEGADDDIEMIGPIANSYQRKFASKEDADKNFGIYNNKGKSYIGVVYEQGRSTIFRMPIYPMLNQWNANPMTPNPGL